MARLNENVRVCMLKGEKGETGYPTDDQVKAQVAKYIDENPEVTIDEEIIKGATEDYIKNTSFISDELNKLTKNVEPRVTALEEKTTKAYLLDMFYPVGSIYISYEHSLLNTPDNLFGGTWEAIPAGTFLMAWEGKGIGGTGGSKKTTMENVGLYLSSNESSSFGLMENSAAFSGRIAIEKPTTSGSGGTTDVNAENNLPPYVKVRMWIRTA